MPQPRQRTSTPSCLSIVAAAGYGKSSALEGYAAAVGADVVSALEALRLTGPDPQPWTRWQPAHALVDDLDLLDVAEQITLATQLATLPDRASITVASRTAPPAEFREALGRTFVEHGPSELALDFLGVHTALRDDFGIDDPDLASRVFGATAGWPDLVQRAGLALSTGTGPDTLVEHLTRQGSELSAWLRDSVIAPLPASAWQLLQIGAHLDVVSADLVGLVAAEQTTHLTSDELAAAFGLVEGLGLVVDVPGAGHRARAGKRLVPMVAAVVRRVSPELGESSLRVAATWYEQRQLPHYALRALQRTGDGPAVAALVERSGDAILAAGGSRDLRRAHSAGLLESGGPLVSLVVADAHRMVGDVTAARRAFEAVDLAADDPLTADLAWRRAALEYSRADYAAALAMTAEGLAVDSTCELAAVRLLACRAAAHLMLGRVEASVDAAREALRLAQAADDDRALSLAHLVVGLNHTGAKRDNHLALAVGAADRAGDVVMAVRIRVNQSDSALRSADYERALDVGLDAVELADGSSPPGALVYALNNVGEALLWLGRCDEARPYFARSVQLCRHHGLARTATGLWGLAEVERHLGRREQAQAAYAEVLDVVGPDGEEQVLVPALAGLARTLVSGSDPTKADLARAIETADTAIAHAGSEELKPCALTARGWVGLAEGRPAAAAELASHALTIARGLRNRGDAAEALELLASASSDPESTRTSLREAEETWRAAGAELARQRTVVRLGRLPEATCLDRAEASAAIQWLHDHDVDVPVVVQPATVGDGTGRVDVRVLGGFEVTVDGQVVAVQAWKSRQARSLLKILVSYRGRPVTRAHL